MEEEFTFDSKDEKFSKGKWKTNFISIETFLILLEV